MRTERTDFDKVSVLRLSGELTTRQCVDQLQTSLVELLEGGRVEVVLNMSDVPCVSMLGLGALVDRLSVFQRFGGDIRFVGFSHQTGQLVRMTGLKGWLQVFDSEAQAIRTYRRAA